jgi:hypothetical protein
MAINVGILTQILSKCDADHQKHKKKIFERNCDPPEAEVACPASVDCSNDPTSLTCQTCFDTDWWLPIGASESGARCWNCQPPPSASMVGSHWFFDRAGCRWDVRITRRGEHWQKAVDDVITALPVLLLDAQPAATTKTTGRKREGAVKAPNLTPDTLF